MPTAVLIDGGYFVKRFRAICPESTHDAQRAADLAWRWAMLHMREGNTHKEQRKHDLYADLLPNVRQKGVDMRIGIDIASLAFKRQVDQIVLMAGDADFVPAAKLARREGIDFILDPMWRSVDPGLNEHIDGLRSTCTRPLPKAPRPEQPAG